MLEQLTRSLEGEHFHFSLNAAKPVFVIFLRWGNAGGGTTFLIMVALYQHLTTQSGLSPHSAWRAAFAIVPVPALLGVAILVLVFGTDHPAGKWEDRHRPLMEAGVEEANPEMERHFLHGDEKIATGKKTDVEEGTETRIVAVEDARSTYRRFYVIAAPDVILSGFISNPISHFRS